MRDMDHCTRHAQGVYAEAKSRLPGLQQRGLHRSLNPYKAQDAMQNGLAAMEHGHPLDYEEVPLPSINDSLRLQVGKLINQGFQAPVEVVELDLQP